MTEPAISTAAVVRRRATERPDQPFLQPVDGEPLSYAAVDDRALRWAALLRGLGVGPGDRVVTLLPTSTDELTLWLGLGWLGAVQVPVNPELRGVALSHCLAKAAPAAAVARPEHVGTLRDAGLGGDAPTLVVPPPGAGAEDAAVADTIALPDLDSVAPIERPAAPPAAWDTAAVLFTSGTSGWPKGVVVPWGQIAATAEGVAPAGWLQPGTETLYCHMPPFHVSGKAPVHAMAALGGRVVVRERFSTSAFWSDVRRHGCTVTLLVGSTAQFLVRSDPHPDEHDNPLRVANLLPLVGEAPQFERRFGVRVCSAFNMTEVSCPILTSPEGIDSELTMGETRPGYECRVVDDRDRPVATGEAGELIVRADRPWTLSAGYLDDPEATIAAWRNLWFHTGDYVRRDEGGRFHFVDRRTDAIRRRGESISSAVLESELMASPRVADCAVVGVPAEFAEAEILAVVVPAQPDRFDASDLAGELADRLPKHMVPRFVRAVDALPRTETAKVRRNVLRETGLTPAVWDRTTGAPLGDDSTLLTDGRAPVERRTAGVRHGT